jgi:quercetin dioxygenase-like cupin family protein
VSINAGARRASVAQSRFSSAGRVIAGNGTHRDGGATPTELHAPERALSSRPLLASSVHFTPGARTAWHTHPNGQTIYVTEGYSYSSWR